MKRLILANPQNIESASITIGDSGMALLSICHKGSSYSRADWFNSITSAKQYFTRYYQSTRWGFDRPIWEKECYALNS